MSNQDNTGQGWAPGVPFIGPYTLSGVNAERQLAGVEPVTIVTIFELH